MGDLTALGQRAMDVLPPAIEDGIEIHLTSAQVSVLRERVIALALACRNGMSHPRVIGWRTADFLKETDKLAVAGDWSTHSVVLPIFEGDESTKLGTAKRG